MSAPSSQATKKAVAHGEYSRIIIGLKEGIVVANQA